MFDRDLVTSGFDCETLISEKYLRYLLLAQIEAGLMELVFDVVDPTTHIPMTVTLHPPADADYQRLYPPSLDAPLPAPVAGSFEIRLLPAAEASAFNDLAFAPDGKHLLTRSVDSIVRVWDLDKRTQDDAAAFEVDPAIGSAFNAAGTQIATASADHNVRIWDLQSKAVVQTLIGHTHVVECVAFSPDGQRLVSGAFDQTARIWDLATGTAVHTLTGHAGRVIAVAFNHAGTQIASGGEDGTVRIWDAQSGAPLQTLSGHTGPVNCVAWSPNDSRVASGSDDKTLRLWDPVAGTSVQTYTGHTGAVLSVDIGVNGARLLSGSADNTLKLWATTGATSLRTITDHGSDVTRVRFSGGANGRNASVSAGGSIRIWDNVFALPVKTIELRMDFMHVDVFATIVVHLPTGDQTSEGNMGLIVYLALNADPTPNGLETNHRLRLSFGRFDELTKLALEQAHVDVPFVEDQIRSRLDRNLALGVAQGQQVQAIRMKKFVVPAGQRTLGMYIDLALRKGPGSDFREPRGSLALAQDFREPASAIAFATAPGLFALLGPDAKFQRAERPPGSSDFRYPLREDLSDPDSDEIGTIDSISVGPELKVPSSPGGIPVPTGRLDVNVEATYTDSTPDVGINVHFFFNPKRDADGIVEWKSDVDVDLGLLATLLVVVGGILFLAPFIGPISVAFWLVVGSMAGLIGTKVAEHLAAKKLAEKADEQSQASVVDALPVRVPAASRRWDPFYLTEHQIVAKLDAAMIIDKKGIAFSAEEIVLDKKPVPREDIAPVGEERDSGAVSAVRYDVPDFVSFANDFTATAPGVDRLDFVRSDPANEPRIVTLTVDQVVERKELNRGKGERRVLAPIVLDAQRIYMVGGQIDQLLSATWRMRTQQRDRLINEFKQHTRDEINANERAAIEQDATADLTAKLGRAPTQEELDTEVELRIDKLVDERRKDYIDGALRDDVHDALAPFLRFDVASEELITLQQAGVFSLDGKEIIVRHNKDGTQTPYYRDHPDGDPRDNLLSLPHYAFPYVPPPPP
jgi:WD40 repeat protein